jgi:hypothetical protein
MEMSIRGGDVLGGIDDEAHRRVAGDSPQAVDCRLDAAPFLQMTQTMIERIEYVGGRDGS